VVIDLTYIPFVVIFGTRGFCVYTSVEDRFYVHNVAPPFSKGEIGFMTFGRTTRSLLGIGFFEESPPND